MNREEQETLAHALSELAAAESAIAPPAALESVLLAEFEAVRRRHWRRWMPMAAVGAVAATLACFALLRSPAPPAGLLAPPAQPPVQRTPAIETAPAHAAAEFKRKTLRRLQPPGPTADPQPFIAIPYTLPLDPHERVTVMRVEMPVSALVSVGLVSAAPDPTVIAPADAIVSQDGRIRALRLLPAKKFASASKTDGVNP